MAFIRIRIKMKGIVDKKELFYTYNNKKFFNFNAIIPEPKYPDGKFNKYEWRTKNWGTPMMARDTEIENDDSVMIVTNNNPVKIWRKLSTMYPDTEISIITFNMIPNRNEDCRKATTKYLNGKEIK